MKTLHPVDEETKARIGAATLICSEYPEVFGSVPMEKFCGMFVDVIPEGMSEREARKKECASEMYALLKTAFGGPISFDEITRLGEFARDLLARIDGKESSNE